MKDSDMFVINVAGWDRWPEVLEYARRRGIHIGKAIQELVNSGLSHERLQ